MSDGATSIVRDWVPFADPRADNALLRDELVAAAAALIEGGPYILGPAVARFEAALAAEVGVFGAVGVGCGTDALTVALSAVGVRGGDEVIVPSHTAGACVAAIRVLNAVPVLVEVEAATACLDPGAVEAAIGPKVKAIVAVHLYGHPADLDRLERLADAHGIALVEDCAQAQGATFGGRAVGSIGAAGCFSFYPTKNLGALGDGGAVVSADADCVARARALRVYGWCREAQFSEMTDGRCSRLDELQAALLTVKLPHLSAWNERRRAIAARYREALAGLDDLILPVERPGARHVYHLYVVRSPARDALQAALAERGIRTGRHYPYPAHLQPGLVEGVRIPAPLSVTERLQREILSLPIFPSMTDAQVERVIDAVRDALRHV